VDAPESMLGGKAKFVITEVELAYRRRLVLVAVYRVLQGSETQKREWGRIR